MVRILFFGVADISKVFLESLYKDKNDLLCITMIDKPAGRGNKLKVPAVKEFALENNIPFIQIENWDMDIVEKIKSFDADLGIAVSFGKIIPQSVFDLPKLKTINIHFSLLPKYRGAAPVQYALWKGEKETGVSSFYIEKTLDSGDILIEKKIKIDSKDTAVSLFDKLIPLGIKVMDETLLKLKSGEIKGIAQTGVPSFAPKLKKDDGIIYWTESAEDIYNKIRALNPYPGTYTFILSGALFGKRLKIIEAEIIETDALHKEAGKIGEFKKNAGFIVYCAKGTLLIKSVQPENKSVLPAWDFLQSGKLSTMDKFGNII
jgi:methionyl-tRNA formyltransferase